MSSSRDKGKGKGKGESAPGLHSTPSPFEPIENPLQNTRPGHNPSNNTRKPKQPPAHKPSSSHHRAAVKAGQQHRRPALDESPRTKKARAAAIRALDRIDDLLPMVEGLQVGDGDGQGKGKGKDKQPQRSGGVGVRNRDQAVLLDHQGAVGQPSRGIPGDGGSKSNSTTQGRAPKGPQERTNDGDGGADSNKNNRHRRLGGKGVAPLPSNPPHDPPSASRAPYDLPTETYAAIIRNPSFDTYLDYPARIHHLKYSPPAPAPSGRAPTTDWEDLHLHQRVSQPRIHARWARAITNADRERMEAHFFHFTATNTTTTTTTDILGFRPYRDVLLLDAAYLAAHRARRATLHRLYRPLADPAASLVPSIAKADRRAKVTLLAVSAAAFASPGASPDGICEVLAAAFPSLRRLLLFAPAVVARPPSAAWDLEVEFARWMPLADAVRLEAGAQQSDDDSDSSNSNKPVAAFARAAGLLHSSSAGAAGRPPLVRAVEAAWARARDETQPSRRARVAAIKTGTSASLIEKTAGSASVSARARASPPVDVAEAETGSQVSSTGAIVAGGEEEAHDESGSSSSNSRFGPQRKASFRAEAVILLYYRDAFERAVSKGWEHEALVPLDHLDLGLE